MWKVTIVFFDGDRMVFDEVDRYHYRNGFIEVWTSRFESVSFNSDTISEVFTSYNGYDYP